MEILCHLSREKLGHVSKKLENSVAANEEPKRSVTENHRIWKPRPIIQHNVMQGPFA
jgi:hypothetical protein